MYLPGRNPGSSLMLYNLLNHFRSIPPKSGLGSHAWPAPSHPSGLGPWAICSLLKQRENVYRRVPSSPSYLSHAHPSSASGKTSLRLPNHPNHGCLGEPSPMHLLQHVSHSIFCLTAFRCFHFQVPFPLSTNKFKFENKHNLFELCYPPPATLAYLFKKLLFYLSHYLLSASLLSFS